MKRFFIMSVTLLTAYFNANALEPLIGGDMLHLLGHPKFIGTANSAAGGPIFSEGSYSMNMNPALTAGLQFPALDFGFTGLLDTENGTNLGANMHLGASFPTRLGVFSLGAHGLFDKDVLGVTSGIFRLGFSRDITDNFYWGLSVWGGVLNFDIIDKGDFAIAADVGAWYRIPKALFLQNIRFGAAFQNLGKTFTYDNIIPFPSMISPKVGIAASLLQVKMFEIGISADVSFPSFINFVVNTGIQFRIANVLNISAGWDFNAQETANIENGSAIHLPYVMVGVRFKIDTSSNSFLHNHSLNEMVWDIDALWQRQYRNTQLFSIGAATVFGERDSYAPVINTGDVRYTE